MTSPTTAPAGWYPDSTQPGMLRWFDGTAWTEHVTPDQPATAPHGTAHQEAASEYAAPWQPLVQPVAQAASPWQGQAVQGSQGQAWQAQPAQHGQWQQAQWQQAQWQQSAPWQYTQPAPADNGPSSAVHWMLPVGRSWQSVVAGYLGLLSLGIWVLGPFAIGIGIWALVRAQSGGHGRGRAITGILGGGIGCVVLLTFALNASG